MSEIVPPYSVRSHAWNPVGVGGGVVITHLGKIPETLECEKRVLALEWTPDLLRLVAFSTSISRRFSLVRLLVSVLGQDQSGRTPG